MFRLHYLRITRSYIMPCYFEYLHFFMLHFMQFPYRYSNLLLKISYQLRFERESMEHCVLGSIFSVFTRIVLVFSSHSGIIISSAPFTPRIVPAWMIGHYMQWLSQSMLCNFQVNGSNISEFINNIFIIMEVSQ